MRAREIGFEAADGTPLRGTLLEPDERPELAVMVSSGTGFPMRFYRRCAEHLAGRGALVLTFDYRGIGASAPEDLAAMKMDYPDWGRLDMPAAAQALRREADRLGYERKLSHLAHSVGGHFAGFMENHALFSAHAFAAVGSGYWRDHPLSYNPFELWFWHVLGPRSLRRHGYVARGGGWTGAPLPRGVFETWKRWCRTPGYYREELAQRLRPHHFDALDAPIRSWVFPDDPIANPRTAADILLCYTAAPSAIAVRAPAELGVRRIGHEGAFRPGCEKLWDEWFSWLRDPI